MRRNCLSTDRSCTETVVCSKSCQSWLLSFEILEQFRSFELRTWLPCDGTELSWPWFRLIARNTCVEAWDLAIEGLGYGLGQNRARPGQRKILSVQVPLENFEANPRSPDTRPGDSSADERCFELYHRNCYHITYLGDKLYVFGRSMFIYIQPIH